jgi:hypothetical protein
VLPQAVSEHYRAQQRLIVATLGLTRAEWSRMGADFDASWARVGPRILLLTASAQLGAARSGAAYVPDTLAELGTPVAPDGEVVPGAFSGVASDGRSLDTLLGESVIRAKVARDNGAVASDALTAAGKALDMYVHTQVADAARGAASVAIAARPTVGWVRMVNPPCCGRCAVLAGKWFRYNQGFQRHPRCDCRHVPAPEDVAGDVGSSPKALFGGGHVKGLTSGQAKAISEGADPARVINASRKASGMTTTEAAVRGRRRLTPDGIYRMATTREGALQLLREHGYLT